MARSMFYYHRSRMDIKSKNASLLFHNDILRIYHTRQGRYGIRHNGTLHNEGFAVNHKKVERIMKELGIKSLVRPRDIAREVHRGVLHHNVLQRDFVAHRANEKWATDVTEFKMCDKKLYLSPILDMYNGEIISCILSHRADL